MESFVQALSKIQCVRTVCKMAPHRHQLSQLRPGKAKPHPKLCRNRGVNTKTWTWWKGFEGISWYLIFNMELNIRQYFYWSNQLLNGRLVVFCYLFCSGDTWDCAQAAMGYLPSTFYFILILSLMKLSKLVLNLWSFCLSLMSGWECRHFVTKNKFYSILCKSNCKLFYKQYLTFYMLLL